MMTKNKINQAWGISAEHVSSLSELMEPLQEVSATECLSNYYTLRPTMSIDQNGIAHIYVMSSLVDSCGMIYETVGHCTSYATLKAELLSAYAQAKAVLLHVDSPGGMVSGNVEIAELVADSPLPIVANVTGMACSAAYMIAVGCDAIVASPSSISGSIGTLWPLFNEKMDFITVLTNEGADLKGAGQNGFSEKQLAFYQEHVNACGAQFQDYVRANREVDEEVFRAGFYLANEALEMGLVDMVGSVEEAEAFLISQG